MRDLSVEGDSTCLQAILDPFGRAVTSVAGRRTGAWQPAYREIGFCSLPCSAW